MRKQIKYYLMLLVLMMAVPLSFMISPAFTAWASNVSGSNYFGTIIIRNTGASTQNITSNISNISTNVLIAGDYLNSTANNCAMRNTSGADIAFMPGYSGNVWMTFVPTIGVDDYVTQVLYFAESTGGEIAYFPDATGMVIADNASLEFAANFSVIIDGRFNTDVVGTAMSKDDAWLTRTTGSGIIAGMLGIALIDIAPGVAGSWQEVDVTPYVGDATGVFLQIEAGNFDVGVRKNGSTDDRVVDADHTWAYVGVDADKKLEIEISNLAVEVYLMGWTNENFTFLTNGVDKSFVGGFAAWNDIDLSGDLPVGAEAAIFEVEIGAVARVAGFREKGSGDNRPDLIRQDSHSWAIIGVDGNREVQHYAQDATVDCYLIGYVTGSDTVFHTNATDKSPAGIGAYEDMDCTAESSASTTWVFLEGQNTSSGSYALKIKGGAEDLYEDGPGLIWAAIPCDSGQVVSVKVADANTDFWINGYSEGDVQHPTNWQIEVEATSITPGEYILEVSADSVNITLLLDGVIQEEKPLAGASMLTNANDWDIGTALVTPYLFTYNHTVGGNLVSDVAWQYGTVFVDQSGSGNPAIPSFAYTSSDPDVTGNMTAFTPISPAQAPAYTLGPANPFITTAPNITGTFTIVPPTGTFPLAGVITAIANATATPSQLPLLIIACFVILAASLTTSYTMRRFGSGSLIVKTVVIASVMGIFVALGDFGIDFWMIVIFLIIATALCLGSRQQTWG